MADSTNQQVGDDRRKWEYDIVQILGDFNPRNWVSIFRVVSSSCEPCDNDPKPMDSPPRSQSKSEEVSPEKSSMFETCLLVCLVRPETPIFNPAAKFQPPSAARCGSSWIPMQSVRIGSFGSAMPSTRRWAEGLWP